MTEYVCKKCCKLCYTSATKVEDMMIPYCENCGGELSKTEPKDKP